MNSLCEHHHHGHHLDHSVISSRVNMKGLGQQNSLTDWATARCRMSLVWLAGYVLRRCRQGPSPIKVAVLAGNHQPNCQMHSRTSGGRLTPQKFGPQSHKVHHPHLVSSGGDTGWGGRCGCCLAIWHTYRQQADDAAVWFAGALRFVDLTQALIAATAQYYAGL